MSRLAYEIVDVFTDRPFAGNPLAVVFGAEALGTDQMQALAREFHLSETVFVLPSGAGAAYRARIFTPETELPFAGHPSIGAAVTAVRRGLVPPGRLVQECGAGLLPISVGEGVATLTGGEPTLSGPLAAAPLLDLVGLSDGDLAGGSVAPARAGCGLEYAFLPVSREAVRRARLTGGPDDPEISVFAWKAESRTAYVRVFIPGSVVPEDPATGSAALGLGVWLVANGRLPGDGTSAYTVHQGAELHRPSVLECTVTAVGGAATLATVRGHVVSVATGEIAVPPFIG